MAAQFANAGHRLDVLCIDHLALVKPSDRYIGNRTQEIEELTAGLKILAKDLDIAVLALSQLIWNLENRDDKRPSLADLRQSGSIEQDADVVMLCYREAYYLSRRTDLDNDETARLSLIKDVIEVDIAEQRAGACPRLNFLLRHELQRGARRRAYMERKP